VEVLSATQAVDFGPHVARILNRRTGTALLKSAETKNGKVVIEFAITKGGHIAEIKLVETSHDTILDRAAWAASRHRIRCCVLATAENGI
jgi:predicted ATP-dependent serine protease